MHFVYVNYFRGFFRDLGYCSKDFASEHHRELNSVPATPFILVLWFSSPNQKKFKQSTTLKYDILITYNIQSLKTVLLVLFGCWQTLTELTSQGCFVCCYPLYLNVAVVPFLTMIYFENFENESESEIEITREKIYALT